MPGWIEEGHIVHVDWGDLRLGLQRSGYQLGPERVLDVLLTGLRAVTPHGWAMPCKIVLHTPTGSETAVDAAGLRRRGGMDVTVRWCAREKDMADIVIADASVAQSIKHRSDDIWIVSSDRDLAYIVGQLTSRAGGGRHALVYLGPKAPGLENEHRRQTVCIDGAPAIHAALARDRIEIVKRRKASQFDVVANAIVMQSGAQLSSSVARERLGGDAWPGLRRLETLLTPEGMVVDHAIGRIWRKSQGKPVPLDRAVAAVRPLVIDTRNAVLIVQALGEAGLVRADGGGRISVSPSWREGLLHPARKLILAVASRSMKRNTLERLLKKTVSMTVGEPATQLYAIARDQYRWANRLVKLSDRDGDLRFKRSPNTLVIDTLSTAQAVLQGVGDSVLPYDDVLRITERAVPLEPARVVRCLRKVGFLVDRGSGLTSGRAAEAPRWTESLIWAGLRE